MRILATFALAIASIASPASAAVLADGGFETQGASTGNYCYFGFSSAGNPACGAGAWSGPAPAFGGSGFQFENNGAWPGLPTPDGTRYAFIQLTGSIRQVFTAAQSGKYTVNWLEAGRPAGCCGGNQRYFVSLSDGVSLSPLVYSGSTFTSQPWTARQGNAAVQLTAGTSYTLTFQGLERVTDETTFIDAVSLDLAPGGGVPEPASWALMLGGFCLIGAAMRRRGKVQIVTA